ncbi:ABC transporter substrate-binding protein [Niveispirillum sp.]|uniref:substrate-binding periplasmic protein n=1 Tax=Niveispirillum sp. TaxID=1917217 RepID=UPI001B7180FE|nr:transporter substrate-binding domain-containing protein [Niveispirillum sp.]MBP7338763.1 transporter substrate-binding domain-containing protein [Niveispirillum sp.]
MMRGRLSLMLVMLLSALALTAPVSCADAPIVRVSDWQSQGQETRVDYFHDLFRRLMVETTPQYGPVQIEAVREKFSQSRLLAELKAGRIDVTWTGTNIERERDGRPVRIPIDMGLIGQRVPVIRTRDAAAFAAIRGVEDLKRFTACQGAQWPDVDVLAASGLPQVTNVHFDQLYAMLRAGRCDYFARGLAEVAEEFETYGGSDLMIFDRLVIAYPMPVYFYVAPGQDALYRRLEEGLRTMVASGELRHMLSTHPSTRGAFPLERFNDATIIRLPNPNLPPATPLSDPTLWLSVGRPGNGPS